ncbi:ATP-binding protein [Sulfurimonas sp.]|uniref:PAS domain-containing sensor histidine kinase n=1 Tax=Sulfurimonas sp. TaxID=2022749 RepID=UPI003561F859
MIKKKTSELSLREKAEEIFSENVDNSIDFSTKDEKTIIHELQVHQIELQMQNEELLSTQNELEKTKQRYLDLYNKAPVGYFELNHNSIIQEVNDTALKLFDVKYSDIVNDVITKFIFIDDQDDYYLFRRKFKILNKQHSIELRMSKSDGTTFWALLETSLNEDDFTNDVFRLVIHDISDRKEYESELKQKDEMLIVQARQAAMGDMIAMIAHQWRQPISIIGMICNNLKLDLGLGNKVTPKELEIYSDDVQAQVKYLSQTIDDFRNFLKSDFQKENISVCDIMNSTMNMIKKSIENNNIKVEIDCDCINNLEIIQSQLNQVFINIINNAKDSLLESNTKDPVISITIYEDEEFINTEICDNGKGIAAHILPKLGEPYVSSKSKNGTGLGLYMSKIIVEEHMNGTLKWKNLDKGACFTIMLRKEKH